MTSLTSEQRTPTHRCKVCGALWILVPHAPPRDLDSWSLFSLKTAPCCDNVIMAEQIEPLYLHANRMRGLLEELRLNYYVGSDTRRRIEELLPHQPQPEAKS